MFVVALLSRRVAVEVVEIGAIFVGIQCIEAFSVA